MKTFILLLLLENICLPNASPDYFRPNSFLNAHLEPMPTERTQREYSGIRIKLFFDVSIQIDSVYRNWTKQAIDFFSFSLKVKPVNSPILIERNCDNPIMRKIQEAGKYQFYCDRRCSRVTTCGSIPIPEDHLNQCKYCSDDKPWSCKKQQNKGSGVENADLILYIGSLRKDLCKHETVAYAGSCAKEETLDRPVAGGINICPSTTQVDLKTKQYFFETIIHEVMHVLGFSKSLYGYFRDPHGNPLTERNELGNPTGHPNKLKLVVSDQVIRFVQRDWHVRGNTILKKEAALIVTPKVVQEVRAHFNCPTLEGAELEDSAESFGHWEARIFHGEVMQAASNNNMLPVFSRITFALLEDTGWYQANYSYAEPLEFGKNLGCDFCTKSCKYWMDKQSDPSPYCNEMEGFYCTADRKAVGECRLKRYSKEPKYQYFDDIKDVSKDQTGFYGGEANADFCPIIIAFTWSDRKKESECIRETNTPNIDENRLLESYGKNALCFAFNTNWEYRRYPGSCSWFWIALVKINTVKQKAGCYKYSCEDGWLHIHVHNRKYTCYQKKQIIEVQILEPITMKLHIGTIICPSCKDICKNNFRCNPDNSYKAQQYKYKKDECDNNVVSKPSTIPPLKPTSTTEWIPFWVTNASSPPSQEWPTQPTRQTRQPQPTKRTGPTDTITTVATGRTAPKTTTTATTSTSFTTGTIIAESIPEAPKTIAETAENPIGTSGTKESSHSVEVQTEQTKTSDSTTTSSVSDTKPAAPWTLLIIIVLIAFLTIFSAIAYFLFKSEKTKKSKAKKQRHRSRSRSERESRRKMTKGKDLRKGETRKEKRDGHKRRKHHRH